MQPIPYLITHEFASGARDYIVTLDKDMAETFRYVDGFVVEELAPITGALAEHDAKGGAA
mgnify:CR=1 FL=1